MTPKPIFTIGLPVTTTREQATDTSRTLAKDFPDYHILLYPRGDGSPEVKFECFNAKDSDQTTLEELKRELESRF